MIFGDLVQLVWEEFLKIIREEAGNQIVETWFKAVTLEKWDPLEKSVYLKAPNQFVQNWIQNHYTNLIKTHLSRLLHTDTINLSFSSSATPKKEKSIIPASILTSNNIPNIKKSYKSDLVPVKKTMSIQKNNRSDISINSNYNFDSFIVGPNNSLAHAAAYAICKNLGQVYNPLFIYGGTGLGKTHLLHAMANEAKKNDPNAIILYETSDHFINEFINSIRWNKTGRFRAKYENVDLLLLDDIQFFSNKEQTQESFFHIFNSLYNRKKQIVFSSDTFPKEIKGLQNRLKSRLECGLVADIQTPDTETKVAILKKKAEQNLTKLSSEVAEFIAAKVISNIRELEGALTRVEAFASLTNQEITIELARKVLINLGSNVHKKNKDGIMLDTILKTVAKGYALSINDLKSNKRHKNIASVRQISFYIMKKMTFCSLKTIGEFIGGRDHSTVIHAIGRVEKKLQSDTTLAQKLHQLEQEILIS